MHMKQWTCAKCFGVYPNGWVKHHHVRQCLGNAGNVRTDMHEDGSSQVDNAAHILEPEASNDTELEHEGGDTTTGLQQQEVLQGHFENRSGEAEYEMMRHYTQAHAKSHIITPKDLEILLFLQATETGNGTSRQQNETMLDYVKRFHTARTILLPKQVKTCMRRVEKV